MEDPTIQQIRELVRAELTGDTSWVTDRLAQTLWTAMRARALRDAKQHIKTRYLESNVDVTTDIAGDDVGFAGPGFFDIINYNTGENQTNLTIESREEGRQLNIDLTGAAAGPVFCHDYLVSGDYTGVDGTTYSTLDGGSFQVYSTITACFAAVDSLTAADPISIGICPGTYTETITWPTATPDHIGVHGLSGALSVDVPSTVKINGAITMTALACDSLITDIEFLQDFTFAGSDHVLRNCSAFGGAWVINTSQGPYFEHCTLAPTSFVVSGSSGNELKIADCEIDVDITATATGAAPRMEIANNTFLAGAQLLLGGGADGAFVWGNRWIASSYSVPQISIAVSNLLTGVAITGNRFAPVTTAGIAVIDISGTNTASLTVTGNTFNYSLTGGTTRYFIRGAAITEVVLCCVGNTFEPRTATPTFFEDDGGISISGKFLRSVFGPNVPANFAVELLTGSADNAYFGSGTVSGPGYPAGLSGALAEPIVVYDPAPSLPNARQYISVGAALPSPVSRPDGALFFDTTTNDLYVNDLAGVAWKAPMKIKVFTSLGEVPTTGVSF